jgi:hypothetical protein
MIDGSVTSSCNYATETFLDSTSRERFRLASLRGKANRPMSDDRFDSILPVPDTFKISRGGIENNNYVTHTIKELQLMYSSQPIVMLSDGSEILRLAQNDNQALVFASNCGCVTS